MFTPSNCACINIIWYMRERNTNKKQKKPPKSKHVTIFTYICIIRPRRRFGGDANIRYTLYDNNNHIIVVRPDRVNVRRKSISVIETITFERLNYTSEYTLCSDHTYIVDLSYRELLKLWIIYKPTQDKHPLTFYNCILLSYIWVFVTFNHIFLKKREII